MTATYSIIFGIVLLIAALFLIIAVMLQNGKSKGTGVVTGGAETFFGKNKGKSIDKKLGLLTAIVAVVFVVIVIAVFMIEQNGWLDGVDESTSSSSSSSSRSSSNSSSTNTNTGSTNSEHVHDPNDTSHTH